MFVRIDISHSKLPIEPVFAIPAHIEDKYYAASSTYYRSKQSTDWPSTKYSQPLMKKSLAFLTENISTDDDDVLEEKPFNRRIYKTTKSSSRKTAPKSSRTSLEGFRKERPGRLKRRHHDSIDSIDNFKFERRKEKKRRNRLDPHDDIRSKVSHRVYHSSDEDCIELTKREELKAALNFKLEQPVSFGSTLLHKLKANDTSERRKVKRTKSLVRSKSNDRFDRDTLHRSLNDGRPALGDGTHGDLSDSSVYAASREISELFDTLAQEKLIDSSRRRMNVVLERRSHDLRTEKEQTEDEDEDEMVSLEEQELRLIALKSAVLKKHEARKKRRMALDDRPYSPTDILLSPEGGSDAENRADKDIVDFENNNMEISPAMSPNCIMKVSECQLMDMDLASSENSNSPVFFYDNVPMIKREEETFWMNGVGLHHPNGSNLIATPFLPSVVPTPVPHPSNTLPFVTGEVFAGDAITVKQEIVEEPADLPPHTVDEDETALRALLIANLKTIKIEPNVIESIPRPLASSNALAMSANAKSNVDKGNEGDEALELDCLRSLLLSSRNKWRKRDEDFKDGPNGSDDADSIEPSAKGPALPTVPEIDRLKEALKRLQNQAKSTTSAKINSIDGETVPLSVIYRDGKDVFKTLCAKLNTNNSIANEQTHRENAKSPMNMTKTVGQSSNIPNGDGIDYRIGIEQENTSSKSQAISSKVAPNANILTPANKLISKVSAGKLVGRSAGVHVSKEIEAVRSTVEQEFAQINDVAPVTANNMVASVVNTVLDTAAEMTTATMDQVKVTLTEPVLVTPVVGKSTLSDPVLTKPGGIRSVTLKPGALKSGVSREISTPEVTNPEVAKLSLAKPGLIQPESARTGSVVSSLAKTITQAIKPTINTADKTQKTVPKKISFSLNKTAVASSIWATEKPNTVIKPTVFVPSAAKAAATKPKPVTSATPKAIVTKPKTALAPAEPKRKPIVSKPPSKVILVPDLRPVRKMIIAINQSDTSSESHSEDDAEMISIHAGQSRKSDFDAIRQFDNASPASIAMDSPSFAPCSPAGDFFVNAENAKGSNEASVTDAADIENLPKTTAAAVEISNVAFQLKLDEYLKSVRENVAKDVKPVVVKPQPVTATKKPVNKISIASTKVGLIATKTPVVSFFNCNFFFRILLKLFKLFGKCNR